MPRWFRKKLHLFYVKSRIWKKNVTAVTSYRTDARHDLARTVTGEGTRHVIGARGVTTIVFDL